MSKMSLPTLLAVAGVAMVSAAAGLSVKVFNWATANHHKTHGHAVRAVLDGLPPQATEHLVWGLVVLALSASILFGLGAYRLIKDRMESNPTSVAIYRLFPLLAVAMILTTQVVVSLVTVLGAVGYQSFAILTEVVRALFLVSLAATASPLFLAGQGRCHPALWRMSAMAAVLAFPCFSLGGTLALLPWRLVVAGH